MKRWSLAVSVVLLAGALSAAHADYVRIYYYLGVSSSSPMGPMGRPGQPGQPGGPPGFPAGKFGGGPGGMPGGLPGMRPGGFGAQGGAPGAAPGGAPGVGFPGLRPPGGGLPGQAGGGAGIGAPPGMQGGGVPGGLPGKPGGGMGFGGGMAMGGMMGMMGGMARGPGGMPGFGRGPGGMMGMMGGMGPGGRPGWPGGPGGFNPATIADDLLDDSVIAEVVVEVQNAKIRPYKAKSGQNYKFLQIFHKWGNTLLMPESDTFKFRRYELPTVSARYEARVKELQGSKDPEKLLDLAKWCLGHGLLKELDKVMQEDLKKVAPTLPAVKNYLQVQAAMKRPITKEDAAKSWKEKLGGYKIKQSAHYSMLHSAGLDPNSDEVENRIKRLEDNYQAYFYWFALDGNRVLPVPDRRLVAVLVNRPDEFYAQHQIFDSIPLIADGFYARRDNLAVFSNRRLDEAYELLDKSAQPLWQQGRSMKHLLKGEGWAGAEVEQLPQPQTMALMLKAMQEESELATVSLEGTRQLIAATGLLPRSVAVPQWVQFGLGSFFETPKGAFWAGTGAPSWTYLVKFQAWDRMKKLDKSEEAIRNLIHDDTFRLAQQMIESQSPQEQAQGRALLLRARTMSWTITYFLMKKHLDEFLAYFKELSNLPRDMEFDDSVFMGCFARAFNLADPNKPNQPNPAKLSKLAQEWYQYIKVEPLEVAEAVQDAIADMEALKKKKKGAEVDPAPKKDAPPAGAPPKGPAK